MSVCSQLTSRKETTRHDTWVGLIQSVEGPRAKPRLPGEGSRLQQPLPAEAWQACPVEFRLVSPHSHLSQFLKISLSGEPWLISRWLVCLSQQLSVPSLCFHCARGSASTWAVVRKDQEAFGSYMDGLVFVVAGRARPGAVVGRGVGGFES